MMEIIQGSGPIAMEGAHGPGVIKALKELQFEAHPKKTDLHK